MKTRIGTAALLLAGASGCGVDEAAHTSVESQLAPVETVLGTPALAAATPRTLTPAVKRAPDDYDGDGISDRAVFRPSNATWFVINSSGAARHDVQWGSDGDVPVKGDYDGDGITDRAVFRPSNATWFVLNSSGAPRQDVQWGADGDIPVPGDYDGDGITDRAVFRPSNATWFVINSSGAARQDVQWGATGDIPVPGDYDGDGITDRAVFRPSNATWFVINSSGAPRQDVQWGVLGDIPVPGDYDGDGITDRAVFRPSNATWFVLNSSGAPRQDMQWGVDGDIPLPNNPGATTAWRPLGHQPTFDAETALLLTDGTVMVHVFQSTAWWRLTPDATGNYVNGTWSQLAAAPSGFSPTFFASAVLPDGRVIVEGGEYISTNQNQVFSSLGAIFDPAANSWTSVSPPAGWSTIGDAQSVVLANGTFMLANSQTNQQALFNASTLAWTNTGTRKADGNDEEGWTLLPSGRVLTVDTTNGTQSEIYDPSSGSWSLAGSTGVSLVDGPSEEIGAAMLLPDGRVFAAGGTTSTALFGTDSIWRTGPTFPVLSEGQMSQTDGPAALLPNGNVLLTVSPPVVNGDFPSGAHFLEFDGTNLFEVARTPNAPVIPSFRTRLLLLPTGDVLQTDGTQDVQIYHPRDAVGVTWAPTITSVSASLTRGKNSVAISGTRFNGVSQAVAYGDDAQAATNYPLVRITNNATGHVFYARTHGHSTMAVATGSTSVSTTFDVPSNAETGASTLVVVANGIASAPVSVTVL